MAGFVAAVLLLMLAYWKTYYWIPKEVRDAEKKEAGLLRYRPRV